MSRKIIGVTVGSSLPKPNFKQTDPTKGDYIKNEPDFDGLKTDVEELERKVGDTSVSEQISIAVDNLATEIYVDEKFAEIEYTSASDDGAGIITIGQSVDNNKCAVMYTAQTLTPEQQAQARENIGAVSATDLDPITANMELCNFGNLIDKDAVSDGLMMYTGHVAADSRFCYTDYIKVTPGETLNFKVYSESPEYNKMRYGAAYDENKVCQAGKGFDDKNIYIVPDGIAYVRVSVRVNDIDHAVLVSGELPESYIPYTGETYFATEDFVKGVIYTKPQIDAKIASVDEELSFAIQSEICPDVPIPLTFEQGYIAGATGQNTDVEYEYAVRSVGYISVKAGDEIKFTIFNRGRAYRLYRYSTDGTYIGRTDGFWEDTTFEATEDCLYRIQCVKTSGTITPDEVNGTFTMTTAVYKRNALANLDGSYVKEAEKVIDTALDETAHLRLLCFSDPHDFSAPKYLKYNEIMRYGVLDYLVGLGDYVCYHDHGEKRNYRKLLVDAISKAGREANRIYVTGNHDVSMKSGSFDGVAPVDLVMHPMECFDAFYRHLKTGIVVDPENPYGCYFYINDAPTKTRLIVLNSNEIVNDDGTVTWYFEQSKISQRQLDWFANTALKVDEEGWSVVVFMHSDYPFGMSENVLFDILVAAKNGTSVSRTFTSYCRLVTNADGTPTGTVDQVNGDTYTVNANFTDGHTVDVIGIVHGHTHFKNWRVVNGIPSISVRNDGVHLDDRYICKGAFIRGGAYYFTDIYGHIYSFTAPDSSKTDSAVQFEYCAYHTRYGGNDVGYFVLDDGNEFTVSITEVSSAPSGATELTNFERERDGSLAGDENCEIFCINKNTRTITTIPYGTGTKRVISY